MARPLHCPHCEAEFTYADWQKNALCPNCGASVSFSAAAGLAQPEPAAAANKVDRRERFRPPPGAVWSVAGKPLVWTRAWTVVVTIWVVVAVLLTIARVNMGRLTVVTPVEMAAITAVENAKMPGSNYTYGEVLRYLPKYFAIPSILKVLGAPTGKQPVWYALDRPWDKTVLVAYEFETMSGTLRLAWTVTGSQATPDPGINTLSNLEKVEKAMAAPQTTTPSPYPYLSAYPSP
jgi:hypothetical protein